MSANKYPTSSKLFSSSIVFNGLEELLNKKLSLWGRLLYYRKLVLWKFSVYSCITLKRLIDIVFSGLGLICLIPVFIVVALLIKIEDSKGTIFYVQKRVGKWGKEFSFPKFRSMVADAHNLKDSIINENKHGENITFKMENDPRITKVGKFIRRFSIDELPQLWCVLIGDMSLVGPRPALPREVAMYNFTQRRRLDCIPGLTCIWQVSGRGDIPFEEQAKLDKMYVDSRSIWMDIKLILLTIPAVLSGRGAY